MADYAITGRKGSGKTLFAVGVIRDALRAGRRVATNVDIRLDALLGPRSKAILTRLPDKPTAADFEAIGRGQAGPVEDDNGVIVLDETSTFFNSRAFGDKDRQPLLDWLVHSRKLGWDVYYICQGLDQIDKQLRTTMIEYHIIVRRTDKWPIPLVTPITAALGYRVGFPKCHIGVCRHGVERDALIVKRTFYRAKDLFNAYDTQQLFLPRDHPAACGVHTLLSAHLVAGRYLPEPRPWWLRFAWGLFGREAPQVEPPRTLKPKLPCIADLATLPPEQAMQEWRRLDALGVLDNLYSRTEHPG